MRVLPRWPRTTNGWETGRRRIRRPHADFQHDALTVSQAEVETLATEIQAGVWSLCATRRRIFWLRQY
jgi:hypothetical protein